MAGITTTSRLSAVAGAQAKKVEKAFGYQTVGDLLWHFPRTYVRKGDVSDLSSLQEGDLVAFVGEIRSVDQHQYHDRRSNRPAWRLEVVVAAHGNELSLTFFDRKKHTADWRRGKLSVGQVGVFQGKVGRFRDKWQLTNPQTRALDAGEAEAEVRLATMPDLIPIYPATATLATWQIEDLIEMCLAMLDDVPDELPAAVRDERGLVGAAEAFRWIHRPESDEERSAALERFRFAEAFVAQAILARRRAALELLPTQPRVGTEGGLLDRFDARLPFTLTAGQQRVSEEILTDLGRAHPMHRLLQGEVGSGKTVVALRAMLRVVDSGGQAALLAPTEVLAQQHLRSITAMLGDLAAGGMLGGAEGATRVALLTGSLGAQARKSAMLDAASGAAGIVIGTHALLEDKVTFADLGLVVVDEQHRFGVEQRAALGEKSVQSPHLLVMTATPIPRTVAMTVFGDLETSTLDELPAGRQPIQTTVVPVLFRPDWLDRAWQRLREEVEKGFQAYVVCPRIGGEGDEQSDLSSVEFYAPFLASGPLHGLRVEALHGRMAPDEKDRVMRAFAAGDLDVLVSTTVIEVGVDVANATAMVVLDADRFGVSQLHQLRGRVGRGSAPGLCLLVTNVPGDSDAAERLAAVAATQDGFELSRVDLRQRREGDVLGVTQSGRRSSLRLLSVLDHESTIVDARRAAVAWLDSDPDLSNHPALADAVRAFDESEQADYMDKA